MSMKNKRAKYRLIMIGFINSQKVENKNGIIANHKNIPLKQKKNSIDIQSV